MFGLRRSKTMIPLLWLVTGAFVLSQLAMQYTTMGGAAPQQMGTTGRLSFNRQGLNDVRGYNEAYKEDLKYRYEPPMDRNMQPLSAVSRYEQARTVAEARRLQADARKTEPAAKNGMLTNEELFAGGVVAAAICGIGILAGPYGNIVVAATVVAAAQSATAVHHSQPRGLKEAWSKYHLEGVADKGFHKPVPIAAVDRSLPIVKPPDVVGVLAAPSSKTAVLPSSRTAFLEFPAADFALATVVLDDEPVGVVDVDENDDEIVQKVRELGQLVGRSSGAVVGGTSGLIVGLVAAPFTFGLSIPAGAVLGSQVGVALGTEVGSETGKVVGRAASRVTPGFR